MFPLFKLLLLITVNKRYIHAPYSFLNISYQNICDLTNKLINFRCSFFIICIYDSSILTETCLSLNINDAELGLVGFHLIRLDKNPIDNSFSCGRWFLIKIKSSFKYSLIILSVNNVEQVFALLSLNSGS